MRGTLDSIPRPHSFAACRAFSHFGMTTPASAGNGRRVLMRRAGAATVSVALFALAGMHAAWVLARRGRCGTAARWRLRVRWSLAGKSDGRVRTGSVPRRWWQSLPPGGTLGMAGRTRMVWPSSASARFMRLDRRVYAPLCLALAGLSVRSHNKPGPGT
jgi:hypothetical protein